MKKLCSAALITILLINVSIAHAQQETLRVVGRIMDVSPGTVANIVRNDKSETEAKNDTLLYYNDKIDIRNAGEITAVINGDIKTFRPGVEAAQISAPEAGYFNAFDSKFFSRYLAILSEPRKIIPTFTYARSTGSEKSKIRANSLTPAGTQYFLKGTKLIAIVWEGGATALTIQAQAATPEKIESHGNAWCLLKIDGSKSSFRVSTDEQQIEWKYEQASADMIPAPPWFKASTLVSVELRLVRATWLLSDGPKEWRSFALTELATLAESGSFIASELWIAARSGEL